MKMKYTLKFFEGILLLLNLYNERAKKQDEKN